MNFSPRCRAQSGAVAFGLREVNVQDNFRGNSALPAGAFVSGAQGEAAGQAHWELLVMQPYFVDAPDLELMQL
jgi:hypothetical protein